VQKYTETSAARTYRDTGGFAWRSGGPGGRTRRLPLRAADTSSATSVDTYPARRSEVGKNRHGTPRRVLRERLIVASTHDYLLIFTTAAAFTAEWRTRFRRLHNLQVQAHFPNLINLRRTKTPKTFLGVKDFRTRSSS